MCIALHGTHSIFGNKNVTPKADVFLLLVKGGGVVVLGERGNGGRKKKMTIAPWSQCTRIFFKEETTRRCIWVGSVIPQNQNIIKKEVFKERNVIKINGENAGQGEN